MPSEDLTAIPFIMRTFPALAQDLQSLFDRQPGLANCEPFMRLLAAMLANYPQVIGRAALAQAGEHDLRQTTVYLKNSAEHKELWLWLMDFKQTMRQACAATPPLFTPDEYAHAWLFLTRCAYRVMEHGRGRGAKKVKKQRSRASRG